MRDEVRGIARSSGFVRMPRSQPAQDLICHMGKLDGKEKRAARWRLNATNSASTRWKCGRRIDARGRQILFVCFFFLISWTKVDYSKRSPSPSCKFLSTKCETALKQWVSLSFHCRFAQNFFSSIFWSVGKAPLRKRNYVTKKLVFRFMFSSSRVASFREAWRRMF